MVRASLERPAERPSREYFGKYRGVVVDNQDPLSKARLRVRVPQVLAGAEVWADPCVPFAGPNLGFFALPEVDTGVWVEFEAGDPSHPIWTGCFWNDGDLDAEEAKPHIRFLRTREVTIRVDDEAGELRLETKDGTKITLDAEGVHVEGSKIEQKAGGERKAVLDSSGLNVNDGALEVK